MVTRPRGLKTNGIQEYTRGREDERGREREREDKERSLVELIEQVVRQLDQGNANWRHFVN